MNYLAVVLEGEKVVRITKVQGGIYNNLPSVVYVHYADTNPNLVLLRSGIDTPDQQLDVIHFRPESVAWLARDRTGQMPICLGGSNNIPPSWRQPHSDNPDEWLWTIIDVIVAAEKFLNRSHLKRKIREALCHIPDSPLLHAIAGVPAN